MQTRGGVAIERMRQGNIRLNPGQPQSFERKSFEKRRTSSEWMDCRAEIMDEAGQRQLGRARATADRRISFQYEHRTFRAGKSNSSRQAIRSGANDDSVILNRHLEGNRKSKSIVRVVYCGSKSRRTLL